MKTPIAAVEIRERREFAYENKFLLSSSVAAAIQTWARTHLVADPHGAGEAGDTYHVSSVYFDTANRDVYLRNGSYGRSKFRVRRYENSDHVFLERKTKTKSLVSKRRSLVGIDELQRMQAPTSDKNWAGYWFQRRLPVRGLKPVCEISYLRTARVGHSEFGPFRLTLDRELKAQRTESIQYSDDRQWIALMDHRWILELKYRYTLPTVFRRLLADFAPTPQPVSKYRLAVEALKLLDDAAVPLQGARSELVNS